MKKIGKITINPEKVIKNEVLVNLRGGYGEDNVFCECGAGITFSYGDCSCNQSQMDRNISSNCAYWDTGHCDCQPCV
jgi:hypothetical protein